MTTPTLDSKLLVKTAERIRERIAERFPDAGLGDVADAVVKAARDASQRSAEIARPNRWLRAGQWSLAVIAALGVAAYFATGTDGQPAWKVAAEFLDAAKGNAALLTAAAVFLFTLETRGKRKRALRAVHELRALAHLIDMLQLGKNPTDLGRPSESLLVSGKPLGAEEMRADLHFCTELLAVVGKLGQLYVQDFPDAQAVAAVDEYEDLAAALSNKVWQKLMILDRFQAAAASPSPPPPPASPPAATLPNGELAAAG
jgi:hypothetical protein